MPDARRRLLTTLDAYVYCYAMMLAFDADARCPVLRLRSMLLLYYIDMFDAADTFYER